MNATAIQFSSGVEAQGFILRVRECAEFSPSPRPAIGRAEPLARQNDGGKIISEYPAAIILLFFGFMGGAGADAPGFSTGVRQPVTAGINFTKVAGARMKRPHAGQPGAATDAGHRRASRDAFGKGACHVVSS